MAIKEEYEKPFYFKLVLKKKKHAGLAIVKIENELNTIANIKKDNQRLSFSAPSKGIVFGRLDRYFYEPFELNWIFTMFYPDPYISYKNVSIIHAELFGTQEAIKKEAPAEIALRTMLKEKETPGEILNKKIESRKKIGEILELAMKRTGLFKEIKEFDFDMIMNRI